MNIKKILRQLKELKKLGVVGIKKSLEDEGASFKEIIIMRKITKKTNLKLNVKIGGCEAKNDIYFCKDIKTDSIVAPMVESSYALKKFLQISKMGPKIPLLINVETITAIQNLSSMINNKKEFKNLSGIVLGRSDLAGSLGLEKKDVNSKKIFNLLLKVFKKIKRQKKGNFIIKMGGSLTRESHDFIAKLYEKKLLDSIETRNVEIRLNKKILSNLENIIEKAFKFEIEWLKEKLNLIKSKNRNQLKYSQDNLRIMEIKKRGK